MVEPLNLKESNVNENVDVLSGRGRRTVRNPGNVQFRTWVDYFRNDYHASCKADKIKISARIVAMVGCCGGRFLEFDESSQRWLLMTDQRAMQKTSQALREDPPLMPVRKGKVKKQQQHLTTKDDNNHNNNNHHPQSQDDNLQSTPSTTNAVDESSHSVSIHRPKFLKKKFWNSARVLQRTKELLGARSKSSKSSSSSSLSPNGSLLSSSSALVRLLSPSSKKAGRKKSPEEPLANLKRKSHKKRRTTNTTPSSIMDGSEEPVVVVNNNQTTTTAAAAASSSIIMDKDDNEGEKDPDDFPLLNHPDDQKQQRLNTFPRFTPRTIDNHKIRATTLALDDSFGSSSDDDHDNDYDNHDDDDMYHHPQGSNGNVPWKNHWRETTRDKTRIQSSNYQLVTFPTVVARGRDDVHDDDDKDELARYTAWHDSSEYFVVSTVPSQILQNPTGTLPEPESLAGQPLRPQPETGTRVLPVETGNATKNTRSTNPHFLPQPHHYKQFFGPGNWMFGGSVST